MNVGRITARWNGFWFAPVDGRRIALFRVALGLYLTAHFATMAPHVEVLFSAHGVYVPYLVPDLSPSPPLAWGLFGAMGLATVSLTLGLWPRASCVVLLALYLHHYFLQLAAKQSSFERLIIIYLVVLAFAQSDRALAPGAAGRRGRSVEAWPERLLRFQTVVLYAGSGLWKALNPHWHGGALLHASFQGMWATPLAFWIVRQDLPAQAWALLSWSVIAFELALGAAFLSRRGRPYAILAGTAFHLANCVVLTIPEFLVSIAPYAVFLPDRWLDRLVPPPAASEGPDAQAGTAEPG